MKVEPKKEQFEIGTGAAEIVKKNLNAPKLTAPNLIYKANSYIVWDGTNYNYYPIRVVEASEHLFRIEKGPPILLGGVTVIKSKLYAVSPSDLLRGYIYKYKLIQSSTNNGSGTNIISDDSSEQINSAKSAGSVRAKDPAAVNLGQQGFSSTTELEAAAINAAWEEQIDTLQHDFSEEEEFEEFVESSNTP